MNMAVKISASLEDELELAPESIPNQPPPPQDAFPSSLGFPSVHFIQSKRLEAPAASRPG